MKAGNSIDIEPSSLSRSQVNVLMISLNIVVNNNMHLSIVTNVKADSPQSNLIAPGKVVDSKKSKDAENCC